MWQQLRRKKRRETIGNFNRGRIRQQIRQTIYTETPAEAMWCYKVLKPFFRVSSRYCSCRD